MMLITTMSLPAAVGLPLRKPDPVTGCQVCAAMATDRTEAEAVGDGSRATDCSVEIRNHPHPRRPQVRGRTRR